MSQTVAGLDAGTNTLRIYIAAAGFDGELVELERQQRFVGLGEGVDATGRLSPEAITRAVAAIDEYVRLLEKHHVGRARFVATSACRDATNRAEFFDAVRARLHLAPELVSGDEEASLAFRGALSGAVAARGCVLVMDSGGGSTEFVVGAANGAISSALSLDIGSRRIRERLLTADPPTQMQVAAARDEVNRQLDRLSGITEVDTFIGVAGTVTTMAALLLGLSRYDRSLVHGSAHEPAAVADLAQRLLAMPVADVAALGPVQPQRAQVLCAGALIVAEAVKRVGRPLIASEADILDGIVASIVVDAKGQVVSY